MKRQHWLSLILLLLVWLGTGSALSQGAEVALVVESPLEGARVTTGQIDVRGYLRGSTELTVNGNTVSVGSDGSWTTQVQLTPGANRIELVARISGQTIKKYFNLFYADGLPVITINQPADQGLVRTSSLNLTGEVAEGVLAAVYLNGSQQSVTTGVNTFNLTLSGLKPGANNIKVSAVDSEGDSREKSLTVWYDDSPALEVTEPSPGQQINGNTVVVKGKAWNVDKLLINDQQVSVSGNSFSYTLAVNDKTDKITLVGSKGNRSVTVEIQVKYTGKPELVIDSPGSGSKVYSNVISISGHLLGLADYSGLEAVVNKNKYSFNTRGYFTADNILLKPGKNTVKVEVKTANLTLSKSIDIYYIEQPQTGASIRLQPAISGGNFKLWGGMVQLTVPPGVFSGNEYLRVRSENPRDYTISGGGRVFAGPVLSIEGLGEQGVTLTVKTAPGLSSEQGRRLDLYRYNGDGNWEPLAGAADSRKGTVTAWLPGNGVYAVLADVRVYADVEGHWAQEDIEALLARGIMSPDSSTAFRPDRALTRAELAVILAKALGLQPLNNNYLYFTDLSTGDARYPYIQAVIRAGYMKGTGNGRFNPYGTVTRAEFMTILSRAGNWTAARDGGTSPGFRDWAQVPWWAKNAITVALQKGYINGVKPGVLAPRAAITKAQAARLLVKMMTELKRI